MVVKDGCWIFFVLFFETDDSNRMEQEYERRMITLFCGNKIFSINKMAGAGAGFIAAWFLFFKFSEAFLTDDERTQLCLFEFTIRVRVRGFEL